MLSKVNIIELFGGIGAFTKACINLGLEFNIVDYVDIDRNCVKSYNALYNKNFSAIDIRNYNPPLAKVDFLMQGSPCQDFSRTGLKKGGEMGSNTRSSLLFETIRIIKEMKEKPKVVIWENVKGVLDKNMRASFFHYLDEMKELGYESKYKILNAMDFGIPQKRERVFVVSILGENKFEFGDLEKVPTRDLSEFLEKDVEDIYEVKQKSMLKFIRGEFNNNKFRGRLKVIDKFAYTISTKQMRVPNAGIIDL